MIGNLIMLVAIIFVAIFCVIKDYIATQSLKKYMMSCKAEVVALNKELSKDFNRQSQNLVKERSF